MSLIYQRFKVDADCEPGTHRIEPAIVKPAEFAEVADGAGDIELLVKTIGLEASFTRRLFAQRGPDARAAADHGIYLIEVAREALVDMREMRDKKRA